MEVALSFPIVLSLLVFVVDAARAYDALIVLTHAVREGARFASLEPEPTDFETRIAQVVVDVVY